MSTQKNKWIEDVLNSTEQTEFTADARIFESIATRINGQVRAVKNLPAQTVWLAVASLALLLALNIAIITFNGRAEQGNSAEGNGYSLNNSFQLY